jgi:long-chain fatty acid transport protein
VHRLEDTPISLGLGVYGIGGFRNVMPANPNDPILASGPLFADAELMQIAPTLSYALTDQLSIGVAPTITSGRLMVDPLGPSAITPDSVHGTGNRVHWGAGFQVGVFYTTETDWQLGFTFKSPQWFEEFQFYTPSGVVGFDLDYPMILSWGVAYRGFSRWVFTTDLRYIDYKNTDGFDALGWRSIFALATGVQYQLTDIIALRAGYNYNQNPIQGEDVLANIATPLIQTQNVAAGVTLTLTENVDAVFSYIYLIDNTVTGALPEGVFGPGATMSHRIRAHSFSLGLTVSY